MGFFKKLKERLFGAKEKDDTKDEQFDQNEIQEENNDEINRSIDTIIKYDLQNIYIKVSRQIEID